MFRQFYLIEGPTHVLSSCNFLLVHPFVLTSNYFSPSVEKFVWTISDIMRGFPPGLEVNVKLIIY